MPALVALPSAYSGETMTPESSEGRERITRVEERVDANRRQIETFAPLVRQVERVQWNLDELTEDFKQFRTDLREQRAEDGKKRADELHDLRRSMSDQILVVTDGLKSCSKKINEIADAQQDWQEAERDRREGVAETEKAEKTSDKMSRRAMWGLIGAAAVTGLLGLITQLITALS